MLPTLGIIAGNGLLPSELANTYLKQGGQCYIIALEGECDIDLIKNFEYNSFYLGSVGAVLDYCRKNKIEEIIFVGGVNRPNLKSIKLDLTGSLLMAKIIKQKFLGDDKILKVTAKFFEGKGFKVISAKDILSIEYANKNDQNNVITDNNPSALDLKDIEFGIKVANDLGKLDIGQSVIIENGYVLGVEAAEGTDNLITRCALLRKKSFGGILVKIMKPFQDHRMDIPVIGPDTIDNLAKFKYNGVAVEKTGVIVVKEEVTRTLANKFGIFILKI